MRQGLEAEGQKNNPPSPKKCSRRRVENKSKKARAPPKPSATSLQSRSDKRGPQAQETAVTKKKQTRKKGQFHWYFLIFLGLIAPLFCSAQTARQKIILYFQKLFLIFTDEGLH